MLRKLRAGFDDFPGEQVQDRIAAILAEWSSQLLLSPQQATGLRKAMAAEFLGSSFEASRNETVNNISPFTVWRVEYPQEPRLESKPFLAQLQSWLSDFSRLLTAEFQVVSIRSGPAAGAVAIAFSIDPK